MRTNHPNRKLHNWLVYRAVDRWLERCSTLVRGHVVDMGAGEAPYREFLAALSNRYTTVDWSMSQHHITVDIVADLNGPLPIPSETVDTVICISVLEHLRKPEAFISEVARVLHPGGHFLLQVPWQWMVHEAPHDFFRYSPYALQSMLADTDLTVQSIESTGGACSTMCLKWNYFSARFVRGPRLARAIVCVTLLPLWTLGQWAALLLDHLDKNPLAEAPGYCVVARRNTPTTPSTTDAPESN
jgi:SAM-dependent methyltransferase